MTLARNLADLGSQVDSSGTLGVSGGGTGQTNTTNAFDSLAPSQTGNSGKYLTTDGTNSSWATIPSTTPAGLTGQIQYNNAGSFGAVSSGTSGQVLTSAGAGSTPTWSTPSSGSYVLVGAYTNNGSATLDIEDVWSTYSNYILVGTNFYINSGASYMQVRLKVNGSYQEGSSYAYINGYCQSSEDDTFRTQRDTAGSRFIIYTGSGQTSTNPANFTINLPNPSSSLKKELYWTSIVSAFGTMIPNFGGGQLGTPTSAITGVRFFDSGAVGFYGTLYVYGLKNS